MKKSIYEIAHKNGDTSKYGVEFKRENINDTQVDLTYAKCDKQWTKPGEKIASAYDNGNYVSINLQNDKRLYLDYAQVEYLRLLLHALDESNTKKHPGVYPSKLNKFQEYK